MDQFISNNKLKLRATLDQDDAYRGAHFIIIAVPTDYDVETSKFDTKAVDDAVADALSSNENALIVIKSTLPVGHTRFLQAKHGTDREVINEIHVFKSRADIIVANRNSHLLTGCQDKVFTRDVFGDN